MMRICNNCYYQNVCANDTLCDDYTPVGVAAEDAEIDELIENGRQNFRAEWAEYISEYND